MRLAGVGLAFFLLSSFHPVHVSVTNIDLEPDEGRVELSIKVFSDDFQNLILNKYSVQLRITEMEKPGNKIGSVNRYIGEAFQLEINGNRTGELVFDGAELNEEALWLRYSYQYGGRIKKLRVRNNLMYEVFDDQTNLVILSYNRKQFGYRMDNKTSEMTFNIK